MTKEHQIEENLIDWLKELKYTYRHDIVDRKTLEQNFKSKFEALNRVRLSESEFLRLLETPDIVYHPRRVKVTIAGRKKVTIAGRAKVDHF